MALILVLSMAACGQRSVVPDGDEMIDSNVPEDTDTGAPEDFGNDAPDESVSNQQLPEGAPNFFQMSVGDEEGNYRSLSAYEDGTGMVSIEYLGAFRKVTTMELSVMEKIAEEVAKTDLASLNGENIYEDGITSASMYIAYSEEEYLGAGYSGTIPQTFLDGFDAMDRFFQNLLANVPEYVPRPVVMGEVNPEALAELEAILDASGVEMLDMFSISDVPKDEFFAMQMGLSKDTGILCGTYCGPVMSATAFSCAVATLEDATMAAEVQKDFAANIDWYRWVCVAADCAMIAQKDNMILCLVSTGELYADTAAAVAACGWNVLEELTI